MNKICKECGESKMKFDGVQDGLKVKVSSFMGGLHWVYENKSGEQLSVYLSFR